MIKWIIWYTSDSSDENDFKVTLDMTKKKHLKIIVMSRLHYRIIIKCINDTIIIFPKMISILILWFWSWSYDFVFYLKLVFNQNNTISGKSLGSQILLILKRELIKTF